MSPILAGNVLAAFCGLALVGSGAVKILGVRKAVDGLEALGFTGRVRLIGIGETVSALLFVFPQTRPIGLLLVSAHMGGAIATHMQHRLSYVAPAALLGLVWAAAWLSHPALFTL